MAVLELLQQTIPWLGDTGSGFNLVHDLAHQILLWPSSIDWNLGALLGALLDTDVFKPVRQFFHYFIQSGQVWALLIGSVVGYLFRSLTSYG